MSIQRKLFLVPAIGFLLLGGAQAQSGEAPNMDPDAGFEAQQAPGGAAPVDGGQMVEQAPTDFQAQGQAQAAPPQNQRPPGQNFNNGGRQPPSGAQRGPGGPRAGRLPPKGAQAVRKVPGRPGMMPNGANAQNGANPNNMVNPNIEKARTQPRTVAMTPEQKAAFDARRNQRATARKPATPAQQRARMQPPAQRAQGVTPEQRQKWQERKQRFEAMPPEQRQAFRGRPQGQPPAQGQFAGQQAHDAAHGQDPMGLHGGNDHAPPQNQAAAPNAEGDAAAYAEQPEGFDGAPAVQGAGVMTIGQ